MQFARNAVQKRGSLRKKKNPVQIILRKISEVKTKKCELC